MSHRASRFSRGGGNKGGAYSSARAFAAGPALSSAADNDLDEKFGFPLFNSPGVLRTAFLFNFRSTTICEEESAESELACLELYFVDNTGATFKSIHIFHPYFLLYVQGSGQIQLEATSYLLKRYEGLLLSCVPIVKEDLELYNHLTGLKRSYLKLSFKNVTDLMSVRSQLLSIVNSNKKQNSLNSESFQLNQFQNKSTDYDGTGIQFTAAANSKRKRNEVLDSMLDLREFDVPYTQRVAIDKNIRVGLWYDITSVSGTLSCEFSPRPDLLDRPLIKKMAFDIETTKAPLKFPDAEIDSIMMISYMLDEQGYLIVNRSIVGKDIKPFDYSPTPEMPGPFTIFNEPDEKSLLARWFGHIQETKPLIYITYNGDFFDWPFIEKRAAVYGLAMKDEIGIWESAGEYMGRFAVHLDAFCWVKRDSYLPQGSQGLKAVTKAKLKYDPKELDPEEMVECAQNRPEEMAAYSVSDAVATYYLYLKYVHSFIFSLCTIIPMSPSDVLRKGSGTLCEVLLMVQAYGNNIVCPNKQREEALKFHHGHLLESETYIGGHVECLESGIFREDIPCKFRLNPKRLEQLKLELDSVLEFAICEEGKLELTDIVNLDEVRNTILNKLETLIQNPNVESSPLIYHLDVGAMYPNIILTNRLQPMAIVDQTVCAACDFNQPGSNCQREMQWSWRGKFFPAKKNEVETVRAQLESESFKIAANPYHGGGSFRNKDESNAGGVPAARSYHELGAEDQAAQLMSRVKIYSHKVYKQATVEEVEDRKAVICQRENSFYVDTVRAFRDRRYEYKILGKKAKNQLDDATTEVAKQQAKDLLLLYDSLQLAHKAILNSFYGYVMRRGARWHSIEMAGVVTATGANIIRDATKFVEDIGRPLELDTDGIWCIIPAAFPENFEMKLKKGGKFTLSYPCSILNLMVNQLYSNTQYQTLVKRPINPDKPMGNDESMEPSQTQRKPMASAPVGSTGLRRSADGFEYSYESKSECSIFFEVDGPYRAMILPAAKEEGKNIKKRYAVFNKDGSLAELKGFEIKRRGELKLIKIFQGEVFGTFLKGGSLSEVYKAVGAVADYHLDTLYNAGSDLTDDEVFELISENKNMSEALSEYGDRKSTSISTARRLGEFLGENMIKDRGLNCKFIITKKPLGAPTSERAIPTAIFQAQEAVKRHFLRKWMKDSSMNEFDIRSLIDWDYYIGRLSSTIQKIITIPAAFQKIDNPVPRVKHPDWLWKKVQERDDVHRQTKLATFFNSVEKPILDAAFTNSGSGDKKIEETKQIEEEIVSDSDVEEINVSKESAIELGDLEDIGSIAGSNSAARDRRKIARVTKRLVEPAKEDTAIIPDESDFPAWLAYQKRQWTSARLRKQRLKKLINGEIDNSTNQLNPPQRSLKLTGSSDLMGFFKEAGEVAKLSYWQIIQVVEDEMPGYFRVWAYLDSNSLAQLLVKVPRLVYVNLKTSGAVATQLASMGRRVDRILPRSRPNVGELFELSMDEAEFRDQKFTTDLMRLGQNNDVEGIYESKIPLVIKLLMELGCCARVDAKERVRAIKAKSAKENEYLMEHLQYKTTSECPYLVNAQFERIFIYLSVVDNRGVIFVQREGSHASHVIVIKPSRAILEELNFKKLYLNQWKSTIEQFNKANQNSENSNNLFQSFHNLNDDEEEENLRFEVIEKKSMAEAYRSLSSLLGEFKKDSNKPAIILLQSCVPLDSIYSSMPSLKHTYPVISLPFSESDMEFPALQWFTVAVRRMFQRSFQFLHWFDEHLDICRYSHIPIGNLEVNDVTAFIVDVFYARSLRQSNHLLWIGEETDKFGLNPEMAAFSADQTNPELIVSGCYREICVELEIGNLCVNTIINSAILEEIEGSMVLTNTSAADGSSIPTAGTYACSDAFKILKQCVTNWFTDSTRHENVYADLLIRNLYRIIKNSNTLLFDPLLFDLIHKLMTKVWLQLLGNFKKLGAIIIHANFHKFTINTKKSQLIHSIAYTNYILNTIQSFPLFVWLSIRPILIWESLLFLDSANYGGISMAENEGNNNDEINEPEPDRISHWNIADYLPPLCSEFFNLIIMEFIWTPFEQQRKKLSKSNNNNNNNNTSITNNEMKSNTTESVSSNELLSAMDTNIIFEGSEFISSTIQRKLLKMVNDIIELYPPDEREGKENIFFPQLPGSHLLLQNPALEFTKSICYILSLDSQLSNSIQRLKENLMKLLKIPSFHPRGKFINPCETYQLTGFICSYCNSPRDLDFCRDSDLIDGNWKCLNNECQQNYERGEIENLLISIVERKKIRYLIQDSICNNCNLTKRNNLNLYCPCSGIYHGEIPLNVFIKEIKIFYRIAQYHQLLLLQYCTEVILNNHNELPNIININNQKYKENNNRNPMEIETE